MSKLNYVLFMGSILLINSTQVSAMAIFDFMKICVFTDVDGVVMLEGKPVSGAKLVRTAKVVFNNDEFKDETITDSEGRFHFDAIYSRSINSFLPSAKMVDQDIFIYLDKKEYHAWDIVKNNYDFNGELNYLDHLDNPDLVVPLRLQCELTDERHSRAAPNNKYVLVSGICRLGNEIKN